MHAPRLFHSCAAIIALMHNIHCHLGRAEAESEAAYLSPAAVLALYFLLMNCHSF